MILLWTIILAVAPSPSRAGDGPAGGSPEPSSRADDWPQLKFDARRSGNAPDREVRPPLGLVGAVPLTDAIQTSPVVADGRVHVVDGSGVAFALDARTLEVVWKTPTRGGAGNVNNVSSPAVIGPYLHFGTSAGYYYVLDRATGRIVREIDCGDAIFSSPAVGNGRAYFVTLGSTVYAVEPDGTLAWTWDFVREVLRFEGDRWSGADWLKHKQGRVTWREHFVTSRDLSLYGRTVLIPAGGRTVFLEDAGGRAELRRIGEIPAYDGREYPACFGQSVGEEGEVYVQWHRRDNAGRVEILRPKGGAIETDFVKGTQTAIHLPGLLSFASVSIRGKDVYRCRPEEGFGLARHAAGREDPEVLAPTGAIASPILLRDTAVYGGLDGALYVVPLGGGPAWSFRTPWGAPITASPAVSGGRIYFGSEDGYLYVLGPDGTAPPPTRDLEVWKIRRPLAGPWAAARYDWYTNYGDFACTNANAQGLKLPLKVRWVRRVEGTVKHIPVCGGGRLYTHTAEGQVIAVEQDTGRLLWRRWWPGVYLSFTSPLYHQERLYVPQAGLRRSFVRCLDAATGKLLWEAPFTGSPSWSRQFPPVLYGRRVIYASGSGTYAPQGSEKPFTFKAEPEHFPGGKEVMSWIYSNDNPYYPSDNRPLIWAWDLETGRLVWQKDFSEYGRGGNDCGLALMDGRLYYSTFFGYAAELRRRRGQPAEANGLTACLDPETGDVHWLTTRYYVTSKCTVSARDGRIYLGGNNRPHERTEDRFITCLNAADGSLVWQSEPVKSALNVITVGERYIFSMALRGNGHVLDRHTGKILSTITHNYACCRFTMSEPYLLGANVDIVDLSDGNRLVSTGPAVDSRECLGAVVSNGRVFYTSQASGFQLSLVGADEARELGPPWERR
jgi:outer membrane protein assembly factor BamB